MYKDQVSLLLKILPDALKDKRIALKGGTAINLFLENFPRFSVDIDLCYLPLKPRDQSLNEIDQIMRDVSQSLANKYQLLTQVNVSAQGIAKQILVQDKKAAVKVEINYVLRGCVYEPKIRVLCKKAQSEFKTYAEVQLLSMEDIYAGKFCAALDRQHPRDLFDVMNFFKHHKFTDRLKDAFLVYLISGNRPIAEMISPYNLDRRDLYEKEFKGMTAKPVKYQDLEEARKTLIQAVNESLTETDKQFLLSFKRGKPLWDLLSIKKAQDMPAIQWKLKNIKKMDPIKHIQALQYLKTKLNS